MSEKVNPVGWFEIPVKSMDRAKAFYEHLLGLALEKHDVAGYKMAWFPMDASSLGAPGALVEGEQYVPSSQGVVIYFSSTDIPAALKRAQEKGGKVCLEKKSIGEYGFIAMLDDSEGNRIALHSRS